MKYFVILLLLIGFVGTLFTIPQTFALCAVNEDWPEAPCLDIIENGWYDQDEVDKWINYYSYKGSVFMEAKYLELSKAINEDRIKKWADESVENRNVYEYYFFSGRAPNTGEYHGKFRIISFNEESAFAYSGEDLIYGSSSFEKVPSSITYKPAQFEIKFQYTTGPYALSNFSPVIEVSPASARSKIHIDVESLEGISQGQVVRIPVTITADPDIGHEKIFLSVYFTGEHFSSRSDVFYKSAWTDSAIIDIESTDNAFYIPKVESNGLPPLKQHKAGTYEKDIQCRNDTVLVLKKSQEFYACVKPSTVPKLFQRNWALNEVEIISTDTAEQDSKLIKIIGVVDRLSTPEGFEYHLIPLEQELPRIEYTGYNTLNLFATKDTVHHFLRNLEGKLVKVEGSFLLENGKYFRHYSGFPTIPVEKLDVIFEKEDLKYSIEGAKLLSVTKIPETIGINIVLQEAQNGIIIIKIPRDLIDAKIGTDDDSFIVLIDGYEVPYTEVTNDFERTLTIKFEEGARMIQVIATIPI